MEEIEFNGDEILFRDEVEVFGERKPEELAIEYDERDDFELEVDTGDFVSLASLVEVEYGDGGTISSLRLKFDELPSVQVEVRRRTEQVDDEIPPVPDIDLSEVDVAGRRSFYNRMRDSSESQPAEIRRLIYEQQELSREEFDRLVDEELGYVSDGGGVGMSLVVLEKVTEEIERQGRGPNQTIVWTG